LRLAFYFPGNHNDEDDIINDNHLRIPD